MALCDAPEWKAGHRHGETGKPIPKKRDGSEQSKPWLSGYYYAIRTLAWGMWASRHNRAGVFDGPMPANDPPPMSSAECAMYVARNA